MAETLQLRVTGMTCGGCENAVQRTLMRLSGVESVAASHARDSVGVIYDPARVTLAAIKAAIEALGYKAHP
jgi:copper chaperone CopZ